MRHRRELLERHELRGTGVVARAKLAADHARAIVEDDVVNVVADPLDHARASKMQRVAVLTMQVCTVLLLLTLLLRTFL